MADCIIVGGGGGGVLSSDVTASKANVLAGKRTVTSDSGDEVVEGTMVNNGTVNQTIDINGSYTIPQGYHSGNGKITQNIATKGTTTYYPSTSDQTIGAGQYLTGNQIIKAVSQQNLVASSIKKGVTVYVKSGNNNIYAVTGTFEGYVPTENNLYYYGTNTARLAYYGSTRKIATFNTNEITFTGQTGNSNYVGYCLGSTTFQINGDRFSKCTISGNLFLDSNVLASTNGLDVHVDLMSAAADYSKIDTYTYRLGTYTYTSTADQATLSSIVVPLTKRGATGCVRIWFQGFYIRSDSTHHYTDLGYSLGNDDHPASIRSIVLS